MESQFIIMGGKRGVSAKQRRGNNSGIVSKSIIKQANLHQQQHNYDDSQQQQHIIQPQPKPFEPYAFNTLSLISSLTLQKPQSLFSQIQAKKQKYYTEKLKQSSLNRQKFMSRIIQMSQSKKSQHYNNHNNINRQQQQVKFSVNNECQQEQYEDSESKRVSLTFSGEHDIESLTNRDNNRIAVLTTDKKQLSIIEMTESIDVSHQQSTKIQQKEHKKKKVKIIKKSNNNNMSMTQQTIIQQQSQQMLQKSVKYDHCSNTSNNSSSNSNSSEFMFLTQYQRDQKQIMDRLLNIIEKEMQFNSRDQQRSETMIMDKMLMSRQQTIKQLEQNRKSRNRRMYKQNNNINHINNNDSTNNTRPDNFKPQTKRHSVIEKPSLMQSKSNENNDDERIHFQQLYQLLKKQQQQQPIAQQKNDNNKHHHNNNNINNSIQQQQQSQSQTISNIIYSPRQLSSINPSHQASANLTLLNYCNEQSQIKNQQNEQKQQKYEEQSQIRQIGKQGRRRDNCERKWQKKKLSYQQSVTQQVTSSQSQHNIAINNPTKQFATATATIDNSKLSQQQQKQQQQTSTNKKKQSVLMQIPFDDDNLSQKNNNTKNKQNITLANAFKKKFGATRGQSKNQSKKTVVKDNKNDENQKIGQGLRSELKQQQNQIEGKSIIIKFNNNNNDINNSNNSKQNINSFQQTPRTQTYNYLSKSNTKSITSNNKNNNSNNKTHTIKEPPKQLIDRLIYGKKVNITKKDMYELTKKNYMKLPEVQEKKRLQEKRQKQIQRHEKIKEYQKRIRASKVNCTASLSHNFQQPSSSTSIMQ